MRQRVRATRTGDCFENNSRKTAKTATNGTIIMLICVIRGCIERTIDFHALERIPANERSRVQNCLGWHTTGVFHPALRAFLALY